MNNLTYEQRNLLNEYIKCYELLGVSNDTNIYYALQNRMPIIQKRFGFTEDESYTKVYDWAKQTLKKHDTQAINVIYNELTQKTI